MEASGWPLPFFAGPLVGSARPGGGVSIEVRDGEALIAIDGSAVLRLPVGSEQDERLAMVLCRLLSGETGKPSATYRQLAEAFGKKSRQDVENHMQKLRRAGGSPARMILDGRGGRPSTLHPDVVKSIAEHWQRDPLASCEETCRWLATRRMPPGVPLPTPEELGRQTRIHGNLLPMRNAVRRLLDVTGGKAGVRHAVLVKRLLEVLDEQDRLLRDAGVEAPRSPGIVERTADGDRSGRISKTGAAFLAVLRPLVSAVSVERDGHLAATTGAPDLAPLRFAALRSVLRLSIGQVAALVGRSKSAVHRGLVGCERVLTALDPFPAAAGFGGILGLDEKWLRIPKSFPEKERAEGRKWRYAHFAVDATTGDLLHVDVYEASDSANIRAFLAALRARGIRPRAVVTDMLSAYAGAIEDTFGPGVTHHHCLFHHLQAVRHRLREKCGPDWKKRRLLRKLVGLVDDIYDCKTRRTARKRLAKVLALREDLARNHPDALPVLDIIGKRFPTVVNALGSKDVPMTNNATERVIRAFSQHYKNMAGLESIATARIQLRLFRFFYRLAPMWETARPEHRGKCPLERAGWDLRGVPMAELVRGLRGPPGGKRGDPPGADGPAAAAGHAAGVRAAA